MIRIVSIILLFSLFFGNLDISVVKAGNDVVWEKPEKIILWEHIWIKRGLLKLLLDPTVEQYGPYEFVKSIPMEQGRAIVSLEKNDLVNILVLPTSTDRERRLLPIHIYMGESHLGYRVCLIQKGSQHRFDHIGSLLDWHESGYIMGTGTHWADTSILEANNLRLVKSAEYELLYAMLDRGRFDCFPRGINQIEEKMKQFGPAGLGMELEVEKRLLFTYPFFSIVFVSRNNSGLKKRILDGYAKAMADGSWQTQFNSPNDSKSKPYKDLNLDQRIVIPLTNPSMTPESLQMDIRPYMDDPL